MGEGPLQRRTRSDHPSFPGTVSNEGLRPASDEHEKRAKTASWSLNHGTQSQYDDGGEFPAPKYVYEDPKTTQIALQTTEKQHRKVREISCVGG